MRAALVAGDGVDLVHDDGSGAGEHGPPALAGEKDVERFRRGHQDVRRLPAHGLARRARGVAGAHHGADAGAGLPGLGQGAVDARERHFQVLVHVVAEGLERRDVDHPGRVGQRRPAAVPDQGVDGGEEPGQGLARAGGGGDEGMASGGHRLPCLRADRVPLGAGRSAADRDRFPIRTLPPDGVHRGAGSRQPQRGERSEPRRRACPRESGGGSGNAPGHGELSRRVARPPRRREGRIPSRVLRTGRGSRVDIRRSRFLVSRHCCGATRRTGPVSRGRPGERNGLVQGQDVRRRRRFTEGSGCPKGSRW